MVYSRLNYTQFFIFLLCASSIYTMDNKLPFKDCVHIIQEACQTNQINDETARAFLHIDHQLSQNIESCEYKTFQTLDLSSVLSSLPKRYPQFLNKVFDEPKKGILLGNISELTTFRLMQGILAQHNKSVTYNEGEKSFFKNIPDESLDIDKEFTRFKADWVLCITGFCNAEAYSRQEHFIADLLEQEICLRNNYNIKVGQPIIYESQVMYKSKNPKKQHAQTTTHTPSTPKQTIEQSQITTDQILVQSITENNQQVVQQKIAQPTETVVAINNQPTTDSISNKPTPTPKKSKLQQPTQKDQKKETQFTTPFYQRPLFVSALMCCAFFAWYFNDHIKTYWHSYYNF